MAAVVGRLLLAALAAAVLTFGFWLLAAQARGTPTWQVVALPAAGIGAGLTWMFGRRVRRRLLAAVVLLAALQPIAGEFARLRQTWVDRLTKVEVNADVQSAAFRSACDELPGELRSGALTLLLGEAIAVLASLQAMRMSAKPTPAEPAASDQDLSPPPT